jgi:Protein of unknown function (DUF3987)
LVLLRDELTGWVRSHNAYKVRGGERELFLSTWNGAPIVVDRKLDYDNGPIEVPYPFLPIHGNIPPDLLCELGDEQAREDGLLHRLLPAFPENIQTQDFTDAAIGEPARRAWAETIRKLYDLEPVSQDPWTPRIVRLTDAARQAFANLYNNIAEDLRASAFLPVLRGPWRKLQTYGARLALIVHFLRWAHGLSDLDVVDADTIALTYPLVLYFQDQARRVYRRIPVDDLDRRANQALAWIKRRGGRVTARDLYRNHVAGIRDYSSAEAILERLVARGSGTVEQQDKGSLVFRTA